MPLLVWYNTIRYVRYSAVQYNAIWYARIGCGVVCDGCVKMHLKVRRGCGAGLGWLLLPRSCDAGFDWLLLPLAPLCGVKVGYACSCVASSALEYGITRWVGMGLDGMGYAGMGPEPGWDGVVEWELEWGGVRRGIGTEYGMVWYNAVWYSTV